MNLGFKYALVACPDQFFTFQFRVYVPTGDSDQGLGTRHASFEPALLLFQRLSDRLFLHAELRDWIPIRGTDFAGNILRYGLGLSYNAIETDSMRIAPVGEVVGWTLLDGTETDAIRPKTRPRCRTTPPARRSSTASSGSGSDSATIATRGAAAA